MGQNRSKWVKIGQNGSTMLKGVTMDKTGQTGQTGSKHFKTGKSGKNGPKQVKMDYKWSKQIKTGQKGPIRVNMCQNGSKEAKQVNMSKRVKMDQNWSKGFKNGLKRFQGDSNQPFPEGRKKTFKKLHAVVQQQYTTFHGHYNL